MATDAELVIAITARDKATADLRKVERQLDRMKKSHKSFADSAAKAFAVGAVVAWGVTTVNKFAEVQDAQSALTATYGQSAKVFEKWARTQATGYNMSAREALNASQTFANFAKAGGLAGQQLERFTIDLVQRAADMASYYGGTVQDAIDAISSGLMGEQEPLRRYGVLLDDATLRAKALELGLVSTTKNALTPQVKVLAAQAAIMDKSTQAAGDAARTQDSLANQIKQANAQWDNAQTAMGEAVATGALPLLQTTNKLLGVFNNLPQSTKTVGIGVAALGAAAVVVVPRLFSMVESFKTLRETSPRTAGAIGKVSAAIAAVGIAYASSDMVKGITDTGDKINGATQDMQRLLASFAETGKGIERFGFTSNGNMHDFAEAIRTAANPGLWDQIGYGLGTLVGGGDGLRLSRESVEGIDAALASMVQGGKAEQAAAAVKRLTDAYVAQGGNADDVNKVLSAYAAAVEEAALPTERTAGAIDKMGTKALSAKAALKGVTDALKAWKGIGTRQGAADDMAAQFDALSEAVKKNKGTLTGNTEAARAARAAFRAAAGSVAEWAGTFSGAKNKAAALDGGVKKLRTKLESLGLSDAEIAKILKPYIAAATKAKELAEAQKGIERDIKVRVTTTGSAVPRGRRDQPAVATGGLITGPGTGTSDSIPALLSNGEFVINAASAKRIGYGNLHRLNRYASGGKVSKAKERLADLIQSRKDAASSIRGSLLGAVGLSAAFDPGRYADAMAAVADAIAKVKDAENALADARRAKGSARTREEMAAALQAEADATRDLASAKADQGNAEKAAAAAKPTPKNVRAGLRGLAKKMHAFRSALMSLARKGLRRDLLAQLVDMGPVDGLEEARALLAATPKDIADLNNTQANIVRDATAIGKFGAGLEYDPLIAAQRRVINGGGNSPTFVSKTVLMIDGREVVTSIQRYKKSRGNAPLGIA